MARKLATLSLHLATLGLSIGNNRATGLPTHVPKVVKPPAGMKCDPSLNGRPDRQAMSTKENVDLREELVKVKKSDLERIMALLSRLEQASKP